MADDPGAPPRTGPPTREAASAPAAAPPSQPGDGEPGTPEAGTAESGTAESGAGKAGGRLRARLLAALALVVVVVGLVWLGFWLLVGAHYVSTDDAYVGADVAQITPQISGQVSEVRVQDTTLVRRGDVLVVIDTSDQKLAVAQAQAEYGRAVRRVRQYLANNEASTAQIAARDADLVRAKALLASAQSDLERAQVDLQRREALASSGAVSGEELSNARNAFNAAKANLDAVKASGAQAQANRTVAQGQLAAGLALTAGSDVDANPEVAVARAALDTALLNQSRAQVRAPVDGVIAQRQVQVGQRVSVGAQLMTVVPETQAYVDANFKEVQLRKVRLGQPVELTADRYGKSVVFHGRVQGLAGGTGSAFAVIPAQNATGNWIKVVQRLPVRIVLDRQDLARHPLRVGLSMNVRIDVAGAVDSPQVPSSHQGQAGDHPPS